MSNYGLKRVGVVLYDRNRQARGLIRPVDILHFVCGRADATVILQTVQQPAIFRARLHARNPWLVVDATDDHYLPRMGPEPRSTLRVVWKGHPPRRPLDIRAVRCSAILFDHVLHAAETGARLVWSSGMWNLDEAEQG